MIKLNKIMVICSILVLIILAGCAKKADDQTFDKTGTEGIVVNFVAGQPPAKIYAEPNSANNLDVVLEIRNKGAYPEPGKGSGINGLGPRFGIVCLGGYDEKI